MKKLSATSIAKSLAALALVTSGGVSFAASTWNFSTCNSNSANQSGTSFGNSWNCAVTSGTGGNNVVVTAWGGANSTGSTGYQTANVSPQSTLGFGVKSRHEGINVGGPNHSVDNNPDNATPDMLLLTFGTSVALGTLTTGWVSGDSDITLMAYTTGTPTILGKTASNLAAGWALVENSAGSNTDGSRSVNSGDVVSSWWLISAYSSSFNGGTLDNGNDYFKLLSLGSKDVRTKVPEPGSLALLGLGLVGLVASRRRKLASV